MRFLLLGLVTGSLYSLSAVALVLVHRATGILNFAQGAVGMTATFTFLAVLSRYPAGLALAAALAVAALLGSGLHLLTAAAGERRLEATVLTIAALGLLQAAATPLFGGHPVSLTRLLPLGSIAVGGARIGTDEVTAAAIALAACGLVILLVQRTRIGLVARAIAERPRVAAAVGIDDRPVLLGVWVAASTLGAMAGILLLTLQPSSDAAALTLVVFDAFAAALLGRLVSLPGAVAGGLLVGVISEAATGLLGVPGAGEAATFLVMVGLLVLRPPLAVRGGPAAAF